MSNAVKQWINKKIVVADLKITLSVFNLFIFKIHCFSHLKNKNVRFSTSHQPKD